MFGKRADLSFLRIIGARTFVHIDGGVHQETRGKGLKELSLVMTVTNQLFEYVYGRNTGRVASSRNVS